MEGLEQNTEIMTITDAPAYNFTEITEEIQNQTPVVIEEFKQTENAPVTTDAPSVEVPEVVEEIVSEVPQTTTEINEETAFNYLKEKMGWKVNSLDELTPKEQKKYAPEMEAFNEFIEKTGNTSYNDYLETQKDWMTETPENKLKEFIRLSYPDLTKEERDYLYNEKYGTENLDPEFEEDKPELLKKSINLKTDLKSATEFLEKRKEEFKANGGSDEHIPLTYREAKMEIDNQKQRQEEENNAYDKERAIFLNGLKQIVGDDFKGFKVSLGNEQFGFKDIAFKQDNIEELRDYLSDSSKLVSEFKDENGRIVKQKEWFEALYFAKNYKTELNKAYNQGISDKAEADDKLSKNIQPDNIISANQNKGFEHKFTIAN